MIHAVKTLPEYFNAYASCLKPYEIRLNDRNYMVGDYLAQNEYEDGEYTGRCAMSRITYILDSPEYCKDGYVVLSLEPCKMRSLHGAENEKDNGACCIVYGGPAHTVDTPPQKWIPKEGDKVRAISEAEHIARDGCYPSVGTVGTIDTILMDAAWVQWPDGSTSCDDCWPCKISDIEPVEEVTP